MMRVLHVIESLGPGGIETTFLNVLRAWRDAPQWATHDVLSWSGGALEGAYQQAADAVILAAEPEAWEPVVLAPYDVIHVTFERCACRMLPFAVSRSRAAVVYGKGYDMGGMFRRDGFAWQPDESLMWGADRVTFTTASLAARFTAPQDRSTVLGKAAAVQRFAALAPPDLATPRRIVCVANLHARKRLGDLVQAVARLRTEFADLAVRFVGADDGFEASRLSALATELDMVAACEIVGRRADVAADLAVARIFALPSGCEGVPTAMLEAMAVARPVLMTDVGDVRSAVTDGVEGYVVAAGDVGALTTRLRTLLTDPALARKMGLAGRSRAMGHDVVAVASRLRGVIEQASERRAA
jgi:glycosyltransferase involved in cell wall biosynthesis